MITREVPECFAQRHDLAGPDGISAPRTMSVAQFIKQEKCMDGAVLNHDDDALAQFVELTNCNDEATAAQAASMAYIVMDEKAPANA